MIERDDNSGVVVLRMHHGKVNAMDIDLLGAIVDRFAALEGDGAPPVVLTGSGRAFSAGLDLHRAVQGGSDYIENMLPVLSAAFQRVFEYPAPVIAAVNGHAIAGGAILACCCDHRVMARGGGRVGVPELHVGVPLPSVALEVVRFTVPPQRLREVLYAGTVYDPDAACAIGLIDELAEPDMLLETAIERAARYATVRAETFALSKRQLQADAAARYRAAGSNLESEVIDQWLAPATLERMSAHVARTVGRG